MLRNLLVILVEKTVENIPDDCLRCSKVYANDENVFNTIVVIIHGKDFQLVAEASERHCGDREGTRSKVVEIR